MPSRRVTAKPLVLPGDKVYEVVRKGSGKQEVATTMAFVRLLRELVKDKEMGARFAPIIPDEARTFGMDSMFPTQKIYNPHGQHLHVRRRQPHARLQGERDRPAAARGDQRGRVDGQRSSPRAAPTPRTGEPMIPVYVFYSMFGFQRTGDSIWAAGDQMARGFLIGATAGRTTLTGEGLQHNDGHSQLLAATNPAVVAYDPGFSYEVAHIVKDGLRRMYGARAMTQLEGENVIYYLTVYNEPYVQPAEPDDLDVDGLLRGIYRYLATGHDDGPQVRLLASGVALPWAVRAREMLAEQWGVGAEVWSVTSWNELRRDGVEAEHHNLVHPDAEPKVPYVHEALAGRGTGRRGLGLDARGARPDPPVGPGPVHLTGHRRVRPLRHPAGDPPALRRRRRVDHGGGARDARRGGRAGSVGGGRGGRQVPHPRPAGGRSADE